ncbi:MAG: mannose-1-phosphate guanylyltransferase [Bdellovibrionota bacterium]
MSSSPWLFVLAGGSGTRFWPRSRAKQPKQFLAIAGDEPLLVTTIRRFHGWIPPERVVVLTTKALEAETLTLLKAFPGAQVIAEPEGRNTAPTLVMAMEWLRARDSGATAVVVPADHWINDVPEYISVMKRAVEAAESSGALCTIGVQPTRAETGYGYIRTGEAVVPHVFRVDRFVEKPKREVAETMVQSPEYLWNSGMFVWSVDGFFRELAAANPDFITAFAGYRDALAKEQDASAAMIKNFYQAPAISIDYALLEKSRKVIVVMGSSFGWNDLGSFVSLEEVYPKSEGGVARAGGRVMAVDSLANIVDAPGKTVALLGVTDMIVVDTGDVILVAAKERAQDVKKIVERLKAEGRKDLL